MPQTLSSRHLARQAETPRAGSQRHPAQTLQSPDRTSLHRLDPVKFESLPGRKERPIGRFAHVNRARFFRPQMRDLVIFAIEKTQRLKRWAIVICKFDEE